MSWVSDFSSSSAGRRQFQLVAERTIRAPDGETRLGNKRRSKVVGADFGRILRAGHTFKETSDKREPTLSPHCIRFIEKIICTTQPRKKTIFTVRVHLRA